MENEALFTLLVNQAAETHRQWRRLVQKYVYGSGPVLENFQKDAAEWTAWKKIGVE